MDSDAEQSEIERLRRENEMLRARLGSHVRMKVSTKGGLSVYGFGKWPVTLYKAQWLALLDMADEIREFIREHVHELADKKRDDDAARG